MKIIVNESGFARLLTESIIEYNTNNGNAYHDVYQDRIESSLKTLETFLVNNGVLMRNVDNGKEYLVFELHPMTELTGRRYGLVQLIKNGKPFDSIYVKPLELYKQVY